MSRMVCIYAVTLSLKKRHLVSKLVFHSFKPAEKYWAMVDPTTISLQFLSPPHEN